jgi:site-specific recombinase XerC
VDTLEDGPERIRLKALLDLLVTSGIRLEELAKARHRNLRLESLPGLPETWVLTVTGKRNKTRDVPLNPEVVRLLATHGKEFIAEDKLVTDAHDLPLIRTLHGSVAQWGCKPKPSEFPADLNQSVASQSIPAKTASKSIGLRLSLKA